MIYMFNEKKKKKLYLISNLYLAPKNVLKDLTVKKGKLNSH